MGKGACWNQSPGPHYPFLSAPYFAILWVWTRMIQFFCTTRGVVHSRVWGGLVSRKVPKGGGLVSGWHPGTETIFPQKIHTVCYYFQMKTNLFFPHEKFHGRLDILSSFSGWVENALKFTWCADCDAVPCNAPLNDMVLPVNTFTSSNKIQAKMIPGRSTKFGSSPILSVFFRFWLPFSHTLRKKRHQTSFQSFVKIK